MYFQHRTFLLLSFLYFLFFLPFDFFDFFDFLIFGIEVSRDGQMER